MIFYRTLMLTNTSSRIVSPHKGYLHAIKFNCCDQFMVMSFAQFTDRVCLRDIETMINLYGGLYLSWIKVMPRFTLAEADDKKDWRIYQDCAMILVKEATVLYKDETLDAYADRAQRSYHGFCTAYSDKVNDAKMMGEIPVEAGAF